MSHALSIAVMSHPRRHAHLGALYAELQRQAQDAATYTQLGCSVTSCVDRNGEGVWSTAKRAWEATLATGAEHCIVVQDDIELCCDFVTTAGMIARLHPDVPVSFYTQDPALLVAQERGIPWIQTHTFVGAQAVMLPAALAREFLAWVSVVCPTDKSPGVGPNDDLRLRKFLLATHRRMWCTAPSLVQHLAQIGTIEGPDRVRHAHVPQVSPWFIGKDAMSQYLGWQSTEYLLGGM